jgi:hypothetical protein
MSANIREYSQWFLGSNNQVADALSCNLDQMGKELTQILFTHVPTLVPPSFKVVPLPNKISSYVTLLLRRLPVQRRYSKEHRTTTIGRGNVGGSTANQLVLVTTTSLNESQETSNNTSSALSPSLCAKGDFLQPADPPLASKTVSGTINHMAAAFQHHGYHNLSHNKHGALDWNLACQLWSYKLLYPKEIQQKAIPLSVLSLIAQPT